MEPFYPLLFNLIVAAGLFAGSVVRVEWKSWALLAALPLLDAALLAAYVFGEDTYRRGGISRWDAYRSPGGALGLMFGGSMAALLLCAALLVYAGLNGRRTLRRLTALAGSACALLLITPTIIGFGAN